MSRMDELVFKKFEEGLSSGEEAELDQLLARDPHAARRCLLLLRLEGDLIFDYASLEASCTRITERVVAKIWRAFEEKTEMRVMEAQRRLKKPSGAMAEKMEDLFSRSFACLAAWFSWERFPRWASWAAAACTILLLLGWWFCCLESMPAVATLKSGESITIERKGAKLFLQAGASLRIGDSLETGEGTKASVQYEDGTLLQAEPKTRITFPAADPRQGKGKFVRLHEGILAASVSGQPEGSPMQFLTSTAEVTVMGTGFRLQADKRSTRLQMKEGSVRFSRLADNKTVTVGAGQQIVATTDASVPLVPGPVGRLLFREDFETGDFAGRGWYDSMALSTTDKEHIAGSKRAAEFHFLPGSAAATSGLATRRLFSESDSIYVSYWIKYSANYIGSDKAFGTLQIALTTNEDDKWTGLSRTHLAVYVAQNEGRPALCVEDGDNMDVLRIGQDLTQVTEARAIAGGNGVSAHEQASFVEVLPTPDGGYRNGKCFYADKAYFQDNAGPYDKNAWHYVEAYIKLNTVSGGKGKPDGILRYWYDGELILDRKNVFLRTGEHPNMKFNQLIIAPFIYEGDLPADQTFWIDDLTASTERE